MNSTVLGLKRISGLRYVFTLTAAALAFCGSASATLLDRGPDMVYDDVLNITWTRNANLPGSSMDWAAANTWAAGLVVDGFSGWRLPYASVSAGAGPTTAVVDCTIASASACRDNEMGYMFFQDLRAASTDSATGTQTALGGQVLTGIQPAYWSGTTYDSDNALLFHFEFGLPIGIGLDSRDRIVGFSAVHLAAWAVRPGDVAAVPEPASLLLIGVGLAGLSFRRRKLAS